MLDRDLSNLYGVRLKRLNEQVKRNRGRFPEDFMFQLTLQEAKAVASSRSQFATLKHGQNIKYRPFVFTEHDVELQEVLRILRKLLEPPHAPAKRQLGFTAASR